jgi:hypothetical protein
LKDLFNTAAILWLMVGGYFHDKSMLVFDENSLFKTKTGKKVKPHKSKFHKQGGRVFINKIIFEA